VTSADRSATQAALCAAYLRAQLGGNRREAVRVILEDGLERGLSCRDVHAVIQRAQQEIGRLWLEDRITVAQEHMATAISQVVTSHVYQYAEAALPNGKKVMVACVEGELHDFPARLVADALDLAGFDVRFLGANVPTPHLIGMLDEVAPDLLVLSVTMTFNLPALRKAVAGARERQPGLRLAVGGGACAWNDGLHAELDADVVGCSADELVSRARQLLGVTP
jgi:methanogenic corrinoid protein MtbC1